MRRRWRLVVIVHARRLVTTEDVEHVARLFAHEATGPLEVPGDQHGRRRPDPGLGLVGGAGDPCHDVAEHLATALLAARVKGEL